MGGQMQTENLRFVESGLYKFWIVAERPRNGSEIDRNRFVQICGHRPVAVLWEVIFQFVKDRK